MKIVGNCVPICICVVGTAFYDHEYANKFQLFKDNGKQKGRIRKMDVKIDFVGYDCVEQFA